jgi:hypothetical protein
MVIEEAAGFDAVSFRARFTLPASDRCFVLQRLDWPPTPEFHPYSMQVLRGPRGPHGSTGTIRLRSSLMEHPPDLDRFFAGQPLSRRLFDAVLRAMDPIGPVTLRVTKSQVAFRRRRAFAWAWMPRQYLRGDLAPLVLTFGLLRRDASPRWKEIVQPVKGRFTHHLELNTEGDIDAEVRSWLYEAWVAAV